MGAPVPINDLPSNIIPTEDLPDAAKAYRAGRITDNMMISPEQQSNRNIIPNAANSAIAQTADTLLNAPANVGNLGAAAYHFLSRSDTPFTPPFQTPNLAQRGMSALGMTRAEWEPQTPTQRLIDSTVRGGVGMAMNPASTGTQLAANLGLGAASGLAGGATTEATGNPNLGASVAMLTPVAAGAMKRASDKSIALAQALKSRNEVEDATLAKAREAGYITSPSEVKPSFVNRWLESISGKAATGQEVSTRNQATTNALAAQELGLPADTALTVNKLDSFRDKVSAPYQEIAAIDPVAAGTLQKLRQVRNDASAYYKHYDVSADPSSQKMAEKLSAQASGLENQLEAMAKQAGKSELVEKMKDARQAIAKSYDIERALNVGNADVSAPVIGRALDKGKPLSGNLQTIGEFQQAFPRATTEGARTPTPGVSKTQAAMAALLGTVGYGAAGPAGIAAAALPMASDPIRALILSKPYQNAMATRNYNGPVLARMIKELPPQTNTEAAYRALMMGRILTQGQQQ